MKSKSENYITGYKKTLIGEIPIISSEIKLTDLLGMILVRTGINRMSYKVKPGVYSVNNPDEKSPIIVTANYKLTFDIVRKELKDLNVWLLVLDTKGVNVWCSAGKGTFGTDELIKQIMVTGIRKLVNHKNIILPQLGAVGVEAHKITEITGMRVIYGPVYARDIKEFIKNGYKKDKNMREVRFDLKDRIVVIPVELIQTIKPMLLMFLISGIFTYFETYKIGVNLLSDFAPYFTAVLTGSVMIPLLLPLIPFKAFSIKGFLVGIFLTIFISIIFSFSISKLISMFFILPAIVSFLALNFTGATTFTSISGVEKEVRIASPLIVISITVGIILKILSVTKII